MLYQDNENWLSFCNLVGRRKSVHIYWVKWYILPNQFLKKRLFCNLMSSHSHILHLIDFTVFFFFWHFDSWYCRYYGLTAGLARTILYLLSTKSIKDSWTLSWILWVDFLWSINVEIWNMRYEMNGLYGSLLLKSIFK